MRTSDYEIVLTRVFNAPRELVFEAWTTVEHLSQWFGPDGYTTKTLGMEFMVGGAWKYYMYGPDGTEYSNLITYTEIVPPERIAFDHGDFESPHFRAVVTFEDQGGKTLLTHRLTFETKEGLDAVVGFGAIELGQQTLRRLASHVETTA